jgi:hypothetical protein
MSLTSYRAAPPRDKPLHTLEETNGETGLANAAEARRSIPSQRLPEKATPRAMPLGCGRYVPTLIRFGKGRNRLFYRFCDSQKQRKRR